MDSVSPRLVLLCGLPGSGKTTFARTLSHAIPAQHLCPDEWIADLEMDPNDEIFRARLVRRFWDLTQDIVTHGGSVILDYGFWYIREREEKRLWAQARGARAELYYFDHPLEKLWDRLEARNAEARHGNAPIMRAQLEEWSGLFQAPSRAEMDTFDFSQVISNDP